MMQRGRLVNAALPMLEASDAASITLVSSVSGREIDFTGPAYGAFKAALVHCAQGLAYKLAGKGIHANTVSPGNTHFEGGTWQQIETGNPELFAQALWPISLMGRSVRRWPNRRNRGHSRFGQPRGSAASCRSRRLEMATPGASARSRRTATNGCCTPSKPVSPQEQTPITHAQRATGRGRSFQRLSSSVSMPRPVTEGGDRPSAATRLASSRRAGSYRVVSRKRRRMHLRALPSCPRAGRCP